MNFIARNSNKFKVFVQRTLGIEEPSALHAPPALRKGVKNIRVQDDLFFQVYWKDVELGKGPALIVYAYELAALQFDCLGAGQGHAHMKNPSFKETKESRMFLPEQTRAEQVERAIFEIRTNLSYYLQRCDLRRIRCLEVDRLALERALKDARSLMLKYADHAPIGPLQLHADTRHVDASA